MGERHPFSTSTACRSGIPPIPPAPPGPPSTRRAYCMARSTTSPRRSRGFFLVDYQGRQRQRLRTVLCQDDLRRRQRHQTTLLPRRQVRPPADQRHRRLRHPRRL